MTKRSLTKRSLTKRRLTKRNLTRRLTRRRRGGNILHDDVVPKSVKKYKMRNGLYNNVVPQIAQKYILGKSPTLIKVKPSLETVDDEIYDVSKFWSSDRDSNNELYYMDYIGKKYDVNGLKFEEIEREKPNGEKYYYRKYVDRQNREFYYDRNSGYYFEYDDNREVKPFKINLYGIREYDEGYSIKGEWKTIFDNSKNPPERYKVRDLTYCEDYVKSKIDNKKKICIRKNAYLLEDGTYMSKNFEKLKQLHMVDGKYTLVVDDSTESTENTEEKHKKRNIDYRLMTIENKLTNLNDNVEYLIENLIDEEI